MHRRVVTTVALFACALAGVTLVASEPVVSSATATNKDAATKNAAPAKEPAVPAKANAAPKKDAPAKKDAATTPDTTTKAMPGQPPAAATRAAAPAAHPETLEEIVARVQKRLAMEVPRGPKPAASRPTPTLAPVTERVKLVWRPTVVWPADLVGAEAR